MALDPKILADRETYPDTIELNVNGVKVTLGDMREFYSQRDEEYGQTKKRVEYVEGEYGKAVNQYNALVTQFNELREQLAAQAAAAGDKGGGDVVARLVEALQGGKVKTVFDQPGDFFKPVVDRLNELAGKIGDIEKRQGQQYEALRKELGGAFTFQSSKDMRRDYRAYDWPKDWPYEKVLAFAKEHNVLETGSGYPDFDAIHERITSPIRAKEETERLVKEAEERGASNARRELSEGGASAFVPGPGFGGGGAPRQKGKFGGIDKIPDVEILNDPDVWNVAIGNGNG